MLCHLAENEAVIRVQQVDRADRRAAEALALSEHGTPADQQLAAYTLSWTHALRGQPIDQLIEAHDALPTELVYLGRHPHRVAGQRLVWRGELTRARVLLESLRATAEERSEPNPAALARLHVCELELRAGRWSDAERLLDEWAESTDSFLLHWPMYERCRALLAAGRGDAPEAKRWARRAMESANAGSQGWDWLEGSRALGLAALLEKELDGAVQHLGAVWEHTQREGVLDPGAFPVGPDLVEALVESGSHDEARAVVQVLAEAAESQGHPLAGAGARRGAAMVAIHADGYTDAAGEELEAAAAAYGDLGCGFDQARTLLALGRTQRRARKWGAARDVLERATSALDAIGSPGWLDAVRASRSGPAPGGRHPPARSRPPSSGSRTWPSTASPTRRSRGRWSSP